MFICKECAEKRKTLSSCGSYGACEICGKIDNCYDIPSSYLPDIVEEEKERLNNGKGK